MNWITNRLIALLRLLMEPLLVGVVIVILWFWVIKPVLFLFALIVAGFVFLLLLNRLIL